MNSLKNMIRQFGHYPSAIVGVIIILALIGLSIYTMVTIPYSEAIRLWRGGEDVWYLNPKNVPPAWTNYFTKKQLPVSFSMDTTKDTSLKEVEETSPTTKKIIFRFPFDFEADDYPQELSLYFDATYLEKQPFVSVTLETPEGEELRVGDFSVSADMNYRLSQDAKLKRRLGNVAPMIGLFTAKDDESGQTLKGEYTLVVQGATFEADSDIDVQLAFYGQVYGLAGTDHMRRDLMIPLLWGIPIALAFGLLAAFGTTFLSMIIAAIGAWYGKWVDGLIQRITEVNLVLPFLPILIMVGTFYSRSIWTILGVTILLSIFTGSIKSYRSVFLQVKESSYIEAAKTYGASDLRIIFVYLIPRMIPLLIPGLVSSVPSFVFLEASLAVLGLGDPVLPTWGKVINDGFVNGALYKGYYYWISEPAVLLMLTGLAFAMLGFALDRIFNPRLRGI